MQGENEYRVRPVTRYVVTHFTSDGKGKGACRQFGEFPNQEQADEVAQALASRQPGATFATLERRPEPIAEFYAYTPEQSDALTRVVSGFGLPEFKGRSAG